MNLAERFCDLRSDVDGFVGAGSTDRFNLVCHHLATDGFNRDRCRSIALPALIESGERLFLCLVVSQQSKHSNATNKKQYEGMTFQDVHSSSRASLWPNTTITAACVQTRSLQQT